MKAAWKVAGFVLGIAFVAGACGRRSPSSVPLGGEEDGSVAMAEEPARDLSQGSPGSADTAEDDAEPEEPEEDEEEEEPDDEEIIVIDDDDDDDDFGGDDVGPTASSGRDTTSASHRAEAVVCDDSKPAIFDCRPLTRACPVLAPLCSVLETVVKPKVGMAVAECIAQERCNPGPECIRNASRLACVDEPARTFCAERYEACSDEFEEAEMTREDCEYGVSSLLPNARRRFTACLATSCDIEGCLLRLLP